MPLGRKGEEEEQLLRCWWGFGGGKVQQRLLVQTSGPQSLLRRSDAAQPRAGASRGVAEQCECSSAAAQQLCCQKVLTNPLSLVAPSRARRPGHKQDCLATIT